METLERLFIDFLLNFVSVEWLFETLGDQRLVAVLIGSLVAVSGALLGTFLVLRRMALTSDAISHTILLGIVVAFLVMTGIFGAEPDIASPWLIIGAAGAGVLTVYLTEILFNSGLVKQDAALGLIFPLLFAVAIILISRYTEDIHLDEDAVLVGEVGVAWANTNSYCFAHCDDFTITPDSPFARVGRECTNCAPNGPYNPRDPQAEFIEICSNCETISAAVAYTRGYTDQAPEIVLWPKALTVVGLIALINLAFVTLFFKELKLTSFDSDLAASLGFRPGLMRYILMTLVSVTAVGAFDAVGAVLVVAFFIVPAATAYLLTDRLSVMLVLSAAIGALSALTGYDLASGNIMGMTLLPERVRFNIDDILRWIDGNLFNLDPYTTWNTNIAGGMVMMTGFFFLLAWVISPRYGVVAAMLRRQNQRQHFAEQLLLGHLYNHPKDKAECTPATLHEHLNWSPGRVQRVLGRVRARGWVQVREGILCLTEQGERRILDFKQGYFGL